MHELTTVLADPELQVEHQVTGTAGSVTCDIVSTGTVPVVVEVFHNCSYLQIKRRLQRVFEAGYGSVFIVMTTDGKYSPRRVEQHLAKVVTGEVRVGRVSIDALTVSLGTRFTPAVVDLPGFDEPGVLPQYVR